MNPATISKDFDALFCSTLFPANQNVRQNFIASIVTTFAVRSSFIYSLYQSQKPICLIHQFNQKSHSTKHKSMHMMLRLTAWVIQQDVHLDRQYIFHENHRQHHHFAIRNENHY